MTLTAIHTRRATKPLSPDEERQARRYDRLIQYAETHEAELLRKVFVGFFDSESAVDLSSAATLVGQSAGVRGRSFHEALISLCFIFDFPGYFFHWKRKDLDGWTPKLCPEVTTKRRARSKQS